LRISECTIFEILPNLLVELKGIDAKILVTKIEPLIEIGCADSSDELVFLGVREYPLRTGVCPPGWAPARIPLHLTAPAGKR
jgi:hypothetical protein